MKPLGAIITKLMTKSLKKKGITDAGQLKILHHWEEIVGAELATRSKPTLLKNGVLTINAPAGAAMELQHQSSQIIEASNGLLSYEGVTRLKFVQ